MNQKKTTNSKVKPLNFDQEVKKFKAHQEKTDLNFQKCDHKGVRFIEGTLVCTCGAAWMGSRLQELFDLFTKKK